MSDEILQQLHFMGFDWLDVMQAIDKQLQTQSARIAKLEAALSSIARNTCCDKCQEAALVASAALAGGKATSDN